MNTLLTKIEENLQEETSSTAFQLAWSSLKRFGSYIADQEAIQRGMQRYAQRFLERHGQIKILGMTEPTPLLEIYTSARVVPPDFLHGFKTTDDLQSNFLTTRRNLFFASNSNPSRPGLELANASQFLNILGAPGAGKSTLLRRLGLEALLPRQTWTDSFRASLGLKPRLPGSHISTYSHDCLPVLVELRRFRTDEINIPKLIQNELSACGLPNSHKIADTLLEDGRLLILLDGIDEIPGDKLNAALDHIRDFIDHHASNRFVTSCRTAFYKDYLTRFTDALLTDFDEEQINSFIQNWFRSDEDRQRGTAKELLSLLNDPTHAAAKELASTPLLLTFLCLSFDGHMRLPPNRSTLYKQALDILLERWAASKRVHNEPIYRELHAELEVQMLADFAASAFQGNRYFFTRSEIQESISDFLREELNAPKHLNSDQILEAIEVQQGIIVQRAQDAYSFSHLTIQEYLTAKWHIDNKQLKNLINNHLYDTRWREVIILSAGLTSKADDLLTQMHTKAKKTLSASSQALHLLKWATESILPTKNETENAARRAAAIALTLDVSVGIYQIPSSEIMPAVIKLLSSEVALNLPLDPESITTRTQIRNRVVDPLLTLKPKSFPIESHTQEQIATQAQSDLIEYINNLCLPFAQSLSASNYFSPRWSTVIAKLEELAKIATKPLPLSEIHSLLKQTRHSFHDALGIPAQLRTLDPQAKLALQEYTTVCQLVLECKDASTRITRSSWEVLCSGLFAHS